MSGNKKIRNATSVKVKGIAFKSQTEKMIYRALVDNGITPEYEKCTFTLWDGFTPVTPFYDQETEEQRNKRNEKNGTNDTSKMLIPKTAKIVGIRYTPDFYFKKGDIDIWIEVKGIENDVFYIKKKLFRKYLDNKLEQEGIKSMFFEIYTKKQLLQALKIIDEYAKSITEN